MTKKHPMRIISFLFIGVITLFSAVNITAQSSNSPNTYQSSSTVKTTITITDENVNKIISSGKPIIIDFWASWCKPCLNMAPIIDEVAKQYNGKVIIGKYNIEEENNFVSQQSIMAIPTLLFFKNGEKTAIRLVGFQNKAAIEEKIEELLAL